VIVFLEKASYHDDQWEVMKGFLTEDKNWEQSMRQSGIDVDRVKERIREIDFEKRNPFPAK